MTKIIYTKEKLEEAVKESKCFSEVCRKLGMPTHGNSYQIMRRRINEYEIDTSHFYDSKKAGFFVSGIGINKRHYKDVLVDDKKRKRRIESHVIRRVLKESGRQYVCSECGLEPIWNGKELTLHVDHINGDWRNCKEENIRFMCPNCHTQTPTYCNKKGHKCKNCNKKIHRKSTYCIRCAGIFAERTRKVKDRPNLEILLKEVEELGYRGTGRKYGVTDNTVRKWIKTDKKKQL